MKRLCSTLVFGRAWLPLRHEFEHHLLVTFAKFSQVEQSVLNGLFTSPSSALKGAGVTALPPKGTVSSHLLPATCSSGAHLGYVTNAPACLLSFNGFVFLHQVELDQLIKGAKKPQQKQRWNWLVVHAVGLAQPIWSRHTVGAVSHHQSWCKCEPKKKVWLSLFSCFIPAFSLP